MSHFIDPDFIFSSGGLLCDAADTDCAGVASGTITAANDAGGTVTRGGQIFTLTHVTTSNTVANDIGFKLNYQQLPCTGVSAAPSWS